MRNNAKCKVVEIESINIKMYDSIIRNLDNVRYISGFKKNLIFFGILDANNYKFTTEGGVMKIIKGLHLSIDEMAENWHFVSIVRLYSYRFSCNLILYDRIRKH